MTRSLTSLALLVALSLSARAEILVVEPSLNVYDANGVHLMTVGGASGDDLDESSAGDIYVCSSGGNVTMVSSSFAVMGSWSAGGSVYGMCIGGSPEMAYFAHSSIANVREYTLMGTFVQGYQPPGPVGFSNINLRDCAFAANGDLWVANFGNGGIMNVFTPPSTTQVTTISAGPISTPFGVTQAPNGDLWVVNQNSPHAVMRYDSMGTLVTTWTPSFPISGQMRDGFAATPNDEILMGGYGESIVRLYDAMGSFISSFNLATGNCVGMRWQGGAASLPTCMITAPTMGASVAGDVALDFDADEPMGAALDSLFEFSTDAGMTWTAATAAAGSTLANPDLARAVPFSATFTWDSAADMVGLAGSQAADLRVTVSNAMGSSNTCTVTGLMVDNMPTCTITSPAPMSTAAGAQDIVFDAAHPAMLALTSTFEFSTDAGLTWSQATATASSPTANPDSARAAPFTGVTFGWDAAADLATLAGPGTVTFRATVDDGVGGASTCMVDLEVACLLCGDCNENQLGPDIIDALAAAQFAAGLSTPSPIQSLCCDVDSSTSITVIDALVIAQAAAGLMPSLSCP